MNYRLLVSAGALAAVAGLSGCNSVSSLDCGDIAEHAQRISQEQQLKITEISNAQEVSRNESEARCNAEATFSDNSQRDLELRAYYQGDNTMVEYTERGGGSARDAGAEAGNEAGPEAGTEEGGENRE